MFATEWTVRGTQGPGSSVRPGNRLSLLIKDSVNGSSLSPKKATAGFEPRM